MILEQHSDEISCLNDLGFSTNPLNMEFDNLSDAFEYCFKFTDQRTSLNYPIDGGVIKINDNYLFEKLGNIGKAPRTWCAIKFPPKEITTQVLDILYQVGRTGKITPVALLKDVKLQGSIIRKATLHNCKEVNDLQLRVNDTVILRKAGDIIPEIVSVLKNLRPLKSRTFINPVTCPSCFRPLKLSETSVDLVCNNYDCPAQVILRLCYYTSRGLGDINTLSSKTLEKFYQLYNINSIAKLYNLPLNDIEKLDGFGPKSRQNIESNINKSKNINDFKFLASIGMDGIGIENAKLISILLRKYL